MFGLVGPLQSTDGTSISETDPISAIRQYALVIAGLGAVFVVPGGWFRIEPAQDD